MSRGHNQRRIVAVYTYCDESSEPVFEVVRYEPKGFAQRTPDPKARGGYRWDVKGLPALVYRADLLLWARTFRHPVYVVEGEKDADALLALDFVATTNPGGAGKWRPAHADQLAGCDVVVIADRDRPGRAHARHVVETLRSVAKSVRLVEPAEGKDISDHLEAGLGLADLVEIEFSASEDHEDDEPRPVATWEELLSRSIERARDEGRNNACLWLVCQARDNDYDEATARQLVARFQAAVDGEGAHSFPLGEAMEVFDKNWDTPKREPWRPSEFHRQPLTDYGNGERLVQRHGESLRYVHSMRSWFVWDGVRFRRDDDGEVVRLAKDTVRAMARVAADEEDETRRKALLAHVARSEGAARLAAMIELAQSEEPVVAAADEFDAHPYLLNVRNGIIQLRTGDLLEHDRRWLQSKLAPVEYDPAASAPNWARFLERVMPDEEDRLYLQRAVGYSLTGDVSEHVLFLLYGTGANGKSTFLETVKAALGDYAHSASADLILAKRPGTIPLEAAGLRGARLVAASETEDGQRLAEAAVKQLTGGDTITARKLYGDYFSFAPTHKLWLGTNHKPTVFGTDEAIWRRIVLIPFTVTIPKAERDRDLNERLRRELPGILNWAVEGCLEWQRYGLGQSSNIRHASATYREDSDVFGDFLEECCKTGDRIEGVSAHLYAAWKSWATDNGLKIMSAKSFGLKLAERGFEPTKVNGQRGWRGIAIRGLGTDGKLRVVGGGP
jgi:putative DNA primase/helicase